jgi:hypothetical protein
MYVRGCFRPPIKTAIAWLWLAFSLLRPRVSYHTIPIAFKKKVLSLTLNFCFLKSWQDPPEPHQNFYPEPELHTNDAAP